MQLRLARRAAEIPHSPIRKFAPLIEAAKSRGTKVIPLNIGQPDLPPAVRFLDAVRSFSQPLVAYEPSLGSWRLRKAWSEWWNSTRPGATTMADEVIVTAGASEAISFALAAVCDPGDEVLLVEPGYANYIGFSETLGVHCRPVRLVPENDYRFPSVEEFAARLTPLTKAIIVSSPNNPTGSILPDEVMRELLRLAEGRGLLLISDETYSDIRFDDAPPATALAFGRGSSHLVVVDSVSKRFSLCGARVGALWTRHEGLRDAITRMCTARLSVATIEQEAVAVLLEGLTQDEVNGCRTTMRRRRDVLAEGLRAIPGVTVSAPQGGFYLCAELPVTDAEAFCRFLLDEFSFEGETVALAPGGGFYASEGEGARMVRFAFVVDEGQLRRSAHLIGVALDRFRERVAPIQ